MNRPRFLWTAAFLIASCVSLSRADNKIVPPDAQDTNAGIPSPIAQNIPRIKSEKKFRAEVAERIHLFLEERHFAKDKEAAAKDYWKKITKQVDSACEVYPSSAAIIYDVLGPAEERTTDGRKEKETRLANHELLKPLVGTLGNPGSSADWILAFIDKASQASMSIIKEANLNPREITRRDTHPTAPIADEGKSPITAGSVAMGYGTDQYRGRYVLDFDGRQISPRVYARTDDKGNITYNVELWDITNPDDPHGRSVPLDAVGTTKFSMTDAAGNSRTYALDFTPYKHATGEAPWEGDTIVRVRSYTGDGTVSQTRKVWLKYLLAERADEAYAGGKGNTLVLGGKTYYVSAQGGSNAGLALYDADQLKAFEEGRIDPMQALPSAVVTTTQRKGAVDAAVGQRAKIVGTDYDLVYDAKTGIWSPAPTTAQTPPPPGVGTPDTSTPTVSGAPSGPSAAPGKDKSFDDAYDDGYSARFQQSDVNPQLAKVGADYRVYQQGDAGPYIALRKKQGGGLEGVRTSPVMVKGKGTVQLPAYCCGSAAGEDKYIPGQLRIVGRTMLHISEEKTTYIGVENPFGSVGQMGNGVAMVTRKDHVADVLTTLPERQGSVDSLVAAMNKKISELGGEFHSLKAMYSDDGWNYFVMTTNSFTYDKGHFAGKGGKAPSGGGAKPPPTAGGGGKQPPKKQMEYSADGKDAPAADAFPATRKIGDYDLTKVKSDADRGWASYSSGDGSCFVAWSVFDGSGKKTGERIWAVSGPQRPDAGGDPCKEPDKFEVSALRVGVPISDAGLNVYWENGKFALYNGKKGDNLKTPPQFISFLIEKK
jgi:hypothetical protein